MPPGPLWIIFVVQGHNNLLASSNLIQRAAWLSLSWRFLRGFVYSCDSLVRSARCIHLLFIDFISPFYRTASSYNTEARNDIEKLKYYQKCVVLLSFGQVLVMGTSYQLQKDEWKKLSLQNTAPVAHADANQLVNKRENVFFCQCAIVR